MILSGCSRLVLSAATVYPAMCARNYTYAPNTRLHSKINTRSKKLRSRAEQVQERRDLQGSRNGPAIRTIYSNYGTSFGS